MKHSSFKSYLARCPYYKGETKRVIYCEGTDQDSSIHLAFAGSSDDHLDLYCRCDWQSCRIAQMLTKKYEEEA